MLAAQSSKENPSGRSNHLKNTLLHGLRGSLLGSLHVGVPFAWTISIRADCLADQPTSKIDGAAPRVQSTRWLSTAERMNNGRTAGADLSTSVDQVAGEKISGQSSQRPVQMDIEVLQAWVVRPMVIPCGCMDEATLRERADEGEPRSGRI